MPAEGQPRSCIEAQSPEAGDRAIDRARKAIGARFRLHGRWPETGLDCVGLIAWAHDLPPMPTGYGLRGDWGERIAQELARQGFARDQAGQSGDPAIIAPSRAGDVIVCQVGPMQYHLCLWSGARIIHACAWLRRVVECRWPAAWHRQSVWRRGEQDAQRTQVQTTEAQRCARDATDKG